MDNVLSFFHNWGPQDYASEHCALDLGKLSKSQLSSLSFMLGGVGDGAFFGIFALEQDLHFLRSSACVRHTYRCT
jgi:hypothetical protein